MVFNDEFSFCKPYLTEEEKVLWEGKPGKGNIFSQEDIFLIPFSIVWCSFAFFWTITAMGSGVPIFWMFGLPFICVGLYLVIGRFIVLIYNRKRTLYVITNKKVIKSCGRKVDTLNGSSIVSVSTIEHKNGCGTIKFNESGVYYSYARRENRMLGKNRLFMLENVADFDKALQAIAGIERNIY